MWQGGGGGSSQPVGMTILKRISDILQPECLDKVNKIQVSSRNHQFNNISRKGRCRSLYLYTQPYYFILFENFLVVMLRNG